MKSKQMLPKPTEVELEILRALWDKGEATVREVFEVVSEQRALGYTSVLKMLQIMTQKGLVARREAGKAHIYRAAATQQETQNQLLRDLSQRLFSGSAAQLAMHALALEPASAEEMDEIRRMIRQKKEKS